MAADEAGRPVVEEAVAAVDGLLTGVLLLSCTAVIAAVGTKAEKADRCSGWSEEEEEDGGMGDSFSGEDDETTVADEWADSAAEVDGPE